MLLWVGVGRRYFLRPSAWFFFWCGCLLYAFVICSGSCVQHIYVSISTRFGGIMHIIFFLRILPIPCTDKKKKDEQTNEQGHRMSFTRSLGRFWPLFILDASEHGACCNAHTGLPVRVSFSLILVL